MANYILKHGVEILRCSNWAMEVVYDNLKEIVQSEGLDNELLIKFLEHLDQNTYGRGCIYIDITDFFNHSSNKLPITLLVDLVEKVIKKIKLSNTFDASFINLLEEFKHNLVLL